MEIPGVGQEFFFNRARLDQSGPRSRCHCLPVSQHCLPGSRVTRMISHILISHFYGRFQISLDFLRFGPEWFQAQMSMSPCPRSRFYFLSLSLFAVSKSWGNDLFCMISFKRISSFLFFLRLWISFPWSRVVTGPAVSVFLSANYSFQHPMLAKMSCLHPCSLHSTSLSLHPWYWCQTWYKESIITNSQVSKMPKLEHLTKRHIHQGKYEILQI